MTVAFGVLVAAAVSTWAARRARSATSNATTMTPTRTATPRTCIRRRDLAIANGRADSVGDRVIVGAGDAFVGTGIGAFAGAGTTSATDRRRSASAVTSLSGGRSSSCSTSS